MSCCGVTFIFKFSSHRTSSRRSAVGTATAPLTGRYGVANWCGGRRHFCSPDRPDCPWSRRSLWRCWYLSQGQSGQGLKLTIPVYLVAKLRMSGAVTSGSICAFITWTGKNSYLPSQKKSVSKRQIGYCSSVDIMNILRAVWPVNLFRFPSVQPDLFWHRPILLPKG